MTARPTSRILTELEKAVGTAKLSTDAAVLAEYSRDLGPTDAAALPLAVVFAESVEDVQATVRTCSATGTRIVPRGAGTGLSGGAHAVENSIVLSLERMNRILEIRPDDEVAVVEPGVINADLNTAAAEHGLMYAPDPASHSFSTIGGNIGTNAGGLRCAKYGVTRDSVLGLDVVLADGTLIRTGRSTFKGVAGYDLTGLLVGSEGTLGIVVRATVRLRYLPVDVRTIAAFYPDFASAAAGVLAVGRARVQPAIMELMDAGSLADADRLNGSDLLARGNALLLIQTDGFGAEREAEVVRRVLAGTGAALHAEDPEEAERLVFLRRNSRGIGRDSEFRVGEDVAVPRSRLVDYVRELERMAEDHRVAVKVVAHAGDGNLHPEFWVDSKAPDIREAMARLDRALDESIDVALAMGGTITGEHGIGSFKLRWLPLEHSERLRELEHGVKAVFDPQGILNPGKAV
ncbi:FAD-linked oxidase C-terminal domain-containing protein [Sinomonas sp. JGH33]|uniref:FAD-linked oxidase C-terminal domain-containing protein n=1 Tax=Sinomonas terricola TaxID=3110330 RepID=A0ABU5T7V7_9MICC|nr:FAD-linked oxidase C-terminal domain-containing protein [Sinomonas sp. JGH33]MEA5455754.1 FAD-linked oxidase C-terminal domain-containing protein [Sinomonas sp. JGH33]